MSSAGKLGSIFLEPSFGNWVPEKLDWVPITGFQKSWTGFLGTKTEPSYLGNARAELPGLSDPIGRRTLGAA